MGWGLKLVPFVLFVTGSNPEHNTGLEMSFGLGAQQTAATWRSACGHESVPPVIVSSKRLKSDLFRNKWILPSYDECHRGGLFLSCDVISCWASWLSLCLREFLRCDSSGHVTMGNRWAYKGQRGWGRPKAGSRLLRWGREGRGREGDVGTDTSACGCKLTSSLGPSGSLEEHLLRPWFGECWSSTGILSTTSTTLCPNMPEEGEWELSNHTAAWRGARGHCGKQGK